MSFVFGIPVDVDVSGVLANLAVGHVIALCVVGHTMLVFVFCKYSIQNVKVRVILKPNEN